MESKKIVLFILVFIAGISLMGGFYYSCNNISNDLSTVFYGIFSSALVILIIEFISFIRDNEKYGHLAGDWHRILITNKLDVRKGDTMYVEMQQYKSSVNPNIQLIHLGGGRYEGFAVYEEGQQKLNFKLDNVSSTFAGGIYQYIDKYERYKDFMPDIGRLEINLDIVDKTRIFINYSNIMPSGIASGYEIWERGKVKYQNNIII